MSAEPIAATAMDSDEARQHLNAHGYVVLENAIDRAAARELKALVDRRMAIERAQPFDPGDGPSHPDDAFFAEEVGPFTAGKAERARVVQRIRADRAREFDTPWPVEPEHVCISFFHIPTLFDDGRSQRVFNLINKEPAFAPLIEHPAVMNIIDAELGRDAVLLDVSINNVGAHTESGGWHVDSPLSMAPEPLPDFTLSIQTVWMLDDFTAENGATLVARDSNLTRRQPPPNAADVANPVVLEGPAGSVAIWLSQTWHQHGGNRTDTPRTGAIVQYGRAWIKPFVDLRTPMTADQAAQFSPRLRYMMGCNANAPVRG